MTAPSSIDPARFLHDQLEVAADFDVSKKSVRRWMRQADVDDGVACRV